MSKSIGSLLAFAVTTSLALANGGGGGGEGDKKPNPYQSGSVSWKPGAGITLAESEEFALHLGSQLQFQWSFTANDNAPDVNTFAVRRARLAFDGHAFSKDLRYMLQLDAVDDGLGPVLSNGPVKDAWAHWTIASNEAATIALRVGQGKTYHGLESTGTETALFFVEESAASRTLGDARTQGAWVHGSHNENKIRWVAGLQNGDVASGLSVSGFSGIGEETANPDNTLTFVASGSFDPMGDTTNGKDNEAFRQGDFGEVQDLMGTVGAGIMIGNNRNAAGTQDIDSFSLNLNTAWWFGHGVMAQGEVFVRNDDPQTGADADSLGWYAQGTYLLPKSGNGDIQWGFGARINGIDVDNAGFVVAPGLANAAGTPLSGSVTEFSLVADAFYHGHACKSQFEITWQDANPDGANPSSTNAIVRVQFQLLF